MQKEHNKQVCVFILLAEKVYKSLYHTSLFLWASKMAAAPVEEDFPKLRLMEKLGHKVLGGSELCSMYITEKAMRWVSFSPSTTNKETYLHH